MSTSGVIDQPRADQSVRPPPLGMIGGLRWAWRQLTSMRTALFLLFLLALAAIPGSVFPQRGVAPLRVSEFFADHSGIAPLLDKLFLFDVYASPWFAAVYLLLMVSLAGCILPRCMHYTRAMLARPPAAPRNLGRLPVYRERTSTSAPEQIVADVAEGLRRDRWRVETAPDGSWVAAEKGYLHELGNLIFHASLLVLLAGVAWGSLLGYRGTVIVIEGEGFANILTQYDDFVPGREFEPQMLQPFSFALERFDATFIDEGPRFGQPADYRADVTYRTNMAADPTASTISVNQPLSIGGTKIFLLGHGYAPRFTVRDARGRTVFSGPVASLPQDPAFTSSTVVKVPDIKPDQLGFNVTITPTAPLQVNAQTGPRSSFPEADNPRVYLGAWSGDLGLDDGVPQNIYQLDTTDMTLIGRDDLAPGDIWQLPDNRGSITFDGLAEFANLQIAHDPGKVLTLAAAAAAIVGLIGSLLLRRRRIWLRASADPQGHTLVAVGGLARSEAAALPAECDHVFTYVSGQQHGNDKEM